MNFKKVDALYLAEDGECPDCGLRYYAVCEKCKVITCTWCGFVTQKIENGQVIIHHVGIHVCKECQERGNKIMPGKKCSLCGTVPEGEWPHTEAACVNAMYRKQQQWHLVFAMMEGVVAAHPCNVEGCGCREARKKIDQELESLKKEETHGAAP